MIYYELTSVVIKSFPLGLTFGSPRENLQINTRKKEGDCPVTEQLNLSVFMLYEIELVFELVVSNEKGWGHLFSLHSACFERPLKSFDSEVPWS